jgi:lipopolysaccharide/colanic/teichoic acid biosynthesis glycosyltransferase
MRDALLQRRSFRRRVFDVCVSVSLLLIFSPLLLVIASLVKLTSPGPVLYRQQRAGLGGRPFTFLKFRSMHIDADGRKAQLFAENEQEGPVFKMKNDPRLTPIGKFLRRGSLDELPQLWNVLRGDMTLIGPRPPMLDEVQKYKSWQLGRLDLTGGLTCLWQVAGRSEIPFTEWVRMDLRYAREHSPRGDIAILFKTVGAVLSRRGAY